MSVSHRLSQELRTKPSKTSVFQEVFASQKLRRETSKMKPSKTSVSHETFAKTKKNDPHSMPEKLWTWAICARNLTSIQKTQLYLHSAPSVTISAEGCARACIPRLRHARCPQRIAPGPQKTQFYHVRRGLHFRLTLFVPPSASKETLESRVMIFMWKSPATIHKWNLLWLSQVKSPLTITSAITCDHQVQISKCKYPSASYTSAN